MEKVIKDIIFTMSTFNNSLKTFFVMSVEIMNCVTLKDLDNAIGQSWSGYNVIARYNGKEYRLFEDQDEATGNGSHLALMQIVCPDILTNEGVNTQLRKYDIASFALRSK